MRETVVYAVAGVCLAGVYLLDRLHKTDGDILKLATELIPEAEKLFLDREKSGAEKLEWVAEQIGEFVPKLLKCFFGKEKIKSMIQFVFDGIAKMMKVK